MTHGLSKKERVCSVTDVAALMAGAHYLSAGPLRCCWHLRDGANVSADKVNRIVISVGKRYFKRAVRRNLLKRRIREAYRLQKELLPAEGYDIMFIFRDREAADFQTVYSTVGTLLKNISDKNDQYAQR